MPISMKSTNRLKQNLKNSKKNAPVKKAPLEKAFQESVIRKLKTIKDMYFFKKEAAAIRGIPDIIGCYKGRFFAWELKRSQKEADKNTGRIVLQKLVIKMIQDCGDIGEVVCPENFEAKLRELTRSS